MKLFLATLFLSLSAYSQTQTPPPISEQYRWLYEILFSEADRKAQPAESFKSFYFHLADSDLAFPKPSEIESKNLTSNDPKDQINSEKDIFNILNIDYIKPKYR